MAILHALSKSSCQDPSPIGCKASILDMEWQKRFKRGLCERVAEGERGGKEREREVVKAKASEREGGRRGGNESEQVETGIQGGTESEVLPAPNESCTGPCKRHSCTSPKGCLVRIVSSECSGKQVMQSNLPTLSKKLTAAGTPRGPCRKERSSGLQSL